ncbi:MAG: EscU/YscU/HrcU family type III secretion system export apparatus switch protein [Thermodesulfobacterium sp.]|uniref:Flagellar biosynthesis protein FlhB n=1 Tax=Candidatus Thermodesulfobacterium syntrophicum TaxID=3060442 RepID=A0AAE3TFM3_9BACT|nr:EscU/YscU/HrcU family type III secretion system export apparatus switch protein [Thermodesulfobacterium sp.]MCD6548095.1 EscU/YscU/HrcU family type III secretion system export apparatus switch protein [Thermodesulfobacterium sp.]MDF2953144.1 Flagellar biosynthesis protein FlhB [Candidatus Thermodesulfobacterium syntrophicum]
MEKKEKLTVAVKYNPQEEAPKVVAKGKGYLAELILKIAKNHNIPIKKDSKLVKELYKLELDKPIPPELYRAVAVVLAWAYNLNKKFKEKILKNFSS